MNRVTVTHPGLFTTIQDAGRPSHQYIGMPVAGAMDLYALQLANYLVDNPSFEAGLEITLMGPTLLFNCDTYIGMAGGSCEVFINAKKSACYRTLRIRKGDEVRIGKVITGSRVYIAFAGGMDITPVMGSKSTYLRGKIGGLDGRPLKEGDQIKLAGPVGKIRSVKLPSKVLPRYTNPTILRITPGPEKERFSWKGITYFLTGSFRLTPQCDRMGYRLAGPEVLPKDNNADIISSGITFGTIQVPSSGQPIIMMADRQTTGGYTRIGHVISADHTLLALLKPGDEVRFKEVSLDEAHALYEQQQTQLVKLRNSSRNRFIKFF